MKIAIYGQYFKESTLNYLEEIITFLEDKPVSISVEETYFNHFKTLITSKKEIQTFKSHEELNSSFEIMLTIGGDGTILRAATYIRGLNIPILGINTGRLGFLATVQKNKITSTLQALIERKYHIKERAVLTVEADPPVANINETNFALNEVTISRKNTTSMITVETYLNDEYLTSYWADGLIVSTPTGSTGYSLSCGGPVIMPDAESVVLTPIAPHNLNARPLVIPDNTSITLFAKGREKEMLVSLDSRITTISHKTKLTIKKASFSIKMIEINDQTFIKTLREKLLWGQDTRN